MWLRYAGISALKWVVSNFLMFVVMLYLIPRTWYGYTLAIPIWIMTFIVAAAFAYWALYRRRPKSRDIVALVVVWLIVSLSLQSLFEFVFIGRMMFVLMSLQLMVMYALEILAIVGVAWYLRFMKKDEGRIEGVSL